MIPFLSSTVTVSFWHFIKNLRELARDLITSKEGAKYLTNFMMIAWRGVVRW
jgi:hypothetical protein